MVIVCSKFDRIEQPPAELFTIWQIFARVTSHRDFDFDLLSLDLELLWYFRRHVFKLCTKFQRNRTIRGRVNDHLAHFRRPVLGGGHFLRIVLWDVWTELHQTR